MHARYQTLGDGLAGFLLHGGPGLDSSYFRPYLEPLADHLQLYFVDLRGSGRALRLPPSEYTIEGMVADLEELRKKENHEKIILLGHSFGGFLSLEYTLRFPRHVAGLILVSTAADTSFVDEFQKNIDRMPAVAKAQRDFLVSKRTDADFKELMRRSLPVYFHDPVAANADAILERMHCGADVYAELKKNYLPYYSVEKKLKEIKVPTLVIAGENDLVVPPRFSKQLADGIVGSTFVTIPNSGHFPFVEGKKKFCQFVRKWLEGVPR